jgi:hypothetical protein
MKEKIKRLERMARRLRRIERGRGREGLNAKEEEQWLDLQRAFQEYLVVVIRPKCADELKAEGYITGQEFPDTSADSMSPKMLDWVLKQCGGINPGDTNVEEMTEYFRAEIRAKAEAGGKKILRFDFSESGPKAGEKNPKP